MLQIQHPRLFITLQGIEALQKTAPTDQVLARLVRKLLEEAERLLSQEPTEFLIIGPRMLARAQQVLSRVSTLALAFRLTRQAKYLARTRQELLVAAAYPHWNPSHFLDTAELCTAFAIGYDW